ncbi:MAG: oligosaccharide flippase family protein [Lachnospiraceae bacterium]|nr:oligosaccharide flippase family protein [Lachnospiraceae bacterium]
MNLSLHRFSPFFRNRNSYLLKGTFFLSATGVLCKIAGFFYKIFLARAIGAQEIGLFNLCLPLCTLCVTLSGGGIATILSRLAAQYTAQKETQKEQRFLLASLLGSLLLSLFCSFLLYYNASFLALHILQNEACAPLLRILSLTIPPAALHACISGYFIGKKQIAVSALSQIFEQMLRIASVLFFYALFLPSQKRLDSTVMALGHLAGELSAGLFCLLFLVLKTPFPQKMSPSSLSRDLGEVFRLSAPLNGSRVVLCLFQAAEAALLPVLLVRFGMAASDALGLYGILSGMVLPLLLFPTALTSSVSKLLLPVVSEAHTLGQPGKIQATVRTSLSGGLLLGLYFFTLFFLFGNELGTLLFSNASAGACIRQFSYLCPLLYVSTILVGILHGLGKTAAASFQSMLSLGLRLLLLLLLIPRLGLSGYLLSALAGQSIVFLLALLTLNRAGSLPRYFLLTLPRPLLACAVTVCGGMLLKRWLFFESGGWICLIGGGLLCSALFFSVYVRIKASADR